MDVAVALAACTVIFNTGELTIVDKKPDINILSDEIEK